MSDFNGQYGQALASLMAQLQQASNGGSVDMTRNNGATPQQMTQAGYPTENGDFGTYMETFNNPQGTVAGNFTPVQRDRNGNVSNILSPDDYIRYAEGVMGGDYPDYRGLQVGPTVRGANAIDRSAQNGINAGNIQEQYLALMRQAGLM